MENSVGGDPQLILWLSFCESSGVEVYEEVCQKDFSLMKSDGRRAQSVIPSLQASVAIFEVDSHRKDALDSLKVARDCWPHMSLLVFLKDFSSPDQEYDFMCDAIREVGVDQIFSPTCTQEQFLGLIKEGIQRNINEKEKNRVHQEIKLQNAKLEEMTGSLELLVAERTRHLAIAKSQVEGKISGIRGLIRFIKDLSSLDSLEDLVGLLRRDIKPFHQVKTICFAFLTPAMKKKIIFLQGGQEFIYRDVLHTWPQSRRIRQNEVEDSQYLANEFGRPFGKTISIPLLVEKDEASLQCQAILFFEHTFMPEDSEHFIDYIVERLQPLSVTFDRIQLEDQVKSASLMWERTFDGVRDPIAILDLDYNLLRSNNSFGESREKLCFNKFKNEDFVCEGCPVNRALESGEPQVGQVKKGEKIYEVHSYPIELVEGSRPTTVVNHYVDVTFSQELQGRVIQNEKMAAVGHLAGNIAHELNNPLTGIRSLSQILIGEVEKGTNLFNDLNEIELAAKRCQRIITNLLEFSRGGSLSNLKDISINEIIEKTVPFLKTAMRQYSCRLELDPSNPVVRVEPQLMQQVVFNLINNACQAMGDSGEIVVKTGLVGESEVWLSVSDTGQGIKDDVLPYVFDAFFTTKSEEKGTGLGLSMSRGIIESFEGSISVESKVGFGTTFTIKIPRIRGRAE